MYLQLYPAWPKLFERGYVGITIQPCYSIVHSSAHCPLVEHMTQSSQQTSRGDSELLITWNLSMIADSSDTILSDDRASIEPGINLSFNDNNYYKLLLRV